MTKNLFFALFVCFCLAWVRAAHAQLVVIANRRTHRNPILQSASLQDEFLNHCSGKSTAAFRVTRRGLVFSGQSAVVKDVAHMPGVIGYIERSTPQDGVKTLLVK